MSIESNHDNINLLKKYIKQLFLYLIKWRYQSNKQSLSWVNSIYRYYYLIQKILIESENGLDITNKLNLQKIYESARRKVITQTNSDKYKNNYIDLSAIIPVEIPTIMHAHAKDMEYLNWDWDFIMNKEYIMDYMCVFEDLTSTVDLDREFKRFK